MKRRRDLHSIKLPELQNNPLDLFPTKGDVIRRTFLHTKSAKELSRRKSQNDDDVEDETSHTQWLSPTKIDPSVSI